MSLLKVFFSYSSKDTTIINRIKEAIVNKTNNSIDIFLSCDGESIPLGANWVAQIEQNLCESVLMFVFISPHSVSSKWIYYESGFFSSFLRKGREIIPVAICGGKLGTMETAPLNMRQGINLSSEIQLNNMLSHINKYIPDQQYLFDLSFTKSDYENIFAYETKYDNYTLAKYQLEVDHFYYYVLCNDNFALQHVLEYINKENNKENDAIKNENENIRTLYPYSQYNNRIEGLGFSVGWEYNNEDYENMTIQKALCFSIDPEFLSFVVPFLDKMLSYLNDITKGINKDFHLIKIKFKPTILDCKEFWRVNGKLYGSDIELIDMNKIVNNSDDEKLNQLAQFLGIIKILSDNNSYDGNIKCMSLCDMALFLQGGRVISDHVSPRTTIDLRYSGNLLEDMNLFNMIDSLFKRKILYDISER